MSGIGSLTEQPSGYVDDLLKLFLATIPSFVKDTTHMLQLLQETPTLPNDALLVNADVTSLYTNIPTEEGLLATRRLEMHRFSSKDVDGKPSFSTPLLREVHR